MPPDWLSAADGGGRIQQRTNSRSTSTSMVAVHPEETVASTHLTSLAVLVNEYNTYVRHTAICALVSVFCVGAAGNIGLALLGLTAWTVVMLCIWNITSILAVMYLLAFQTSTYNVRHPRIDGSLALTECNDASRVCSVCLEPVRKLAFKTACGHDFHLGCIERWSSFSTEIQCPVCRTPLRKFRHSLLLIEE